MKPETQRILLITGLIISAIILSFFFWPEWTDWKVRLGIMALAVTASLMYRERPLRRRPLRIKKDDSLELERQRLKNWADSWR